MRTTEELHDASERQAKKAYDSYHKLNTHLAAMQMQDALRLATLAQVAATLEVAEPQVVYQETTFGPKAVGIDVQTD